MYSLYCHYHVKIINSWTYLLCVVAYMALFFYTFVRQVASVLSIGNLPHFILICYMNVDCSMWPNKILSLSLSLEAILYHRIPDVTDTTGKDYKATLRLQLKLESLLWS